MKSFFSFSTGTTTAATVAAVVAVVAVVVLTGMESFKGGNSSLKLGLISEDLIAFNLASSTAFFSACMRSKPLSASLSKCTKACWRYEWREEQVMTLNKVGKD